MEVIDCTVKDAKALAEMNQDLIEDEKAETVLSREQLLERMTGFIQSDYRAFRFVIDGRTVGYALCNTMRTPVYLRQFFICREERRRNYGTQAFHALLAHLNIKEIEIDVYAWNQPGVAFWESLGFIKRCYNMRYRL